MPDTVFSFKHPTVRLVMDCIVVLLLMVAVYQQAQNRDLGNKIVKAQAQIKQTQAAAIKEQTRVNNKFASVLAKGCVASNSARLSLKNLLIAVDSASQANPNRTPEEKQTSHQFFIKQIQNIHITDCSKYRVVTQN